LDDAQSLTNRIVDVATHLFLSDGFEATSLEKIAKEAGVSKRTLYSRFDSKSELFKAVVARYTTRNAAAIVPLQHPSATNVERLTHICIETLGFCLNASVIALERVMMAEVERFPELALVVNDYATAHLKEPLRQVLQDGMASLMGLIGATSGCPRPPRKPCAAQTKSIPLSRCRQNTPYGPATLRTRSCLPPANLA